jgi:hypothetical protein
VVTLVARRGRSSLGAIGSRNVATKAPVFAHHLRLYSQSAGDRAAVMIL